LQTYGKIDSKFRFVILASKRAKQLLRGAKAKVKSKSKNPIRIAQIELKEGLVDYEILQSKHENILEAEEQVLSVDAGAEDAEETGGDIVGDEELGEGGEAAEEAGGDYEEDFAGGDSSEGKDDE